MRIWFAAMLAMWLAACGPAVPPAEVEATLGKIKAETIVELEKIKAELKPGIAALKTAGKKDEAQVKADEANVRLLEAYNKGNQAMLAAGMDLMNRATGDSENIKEIRRQAKEAQDELAAAAKKSKFSVE